MNLIGKVVVIVTAVLAFAWPEVSLSGDKVSLRWKPFNQGLAEAKKTNKKILVDVFTDWCGWCKRMDQEVYANAAVAQYLAKNYVVIKLDAESEAKLRYDDRTMSEMELAQGFGVTGYPTTLFMKPDGDPITSVPGYIPAETFIDILKFIGEDHYLTMKWEEYTKR